MSQDPNPFAPSLETLPETLPIFPLPGVLLLPGGKLPLNIFEPRYLDMVREAMGQSRMIGMVQPATEDDAPTEDDDSSGFDVEAMAGGETVPTAERESGGESDVGSAPVYKVGCAGRIVEFGETDDGRFLITLRGVIRFRIRRELPLLSGYRRIVPDFNAFADDLDASKAYFDRSRLLDALHYYFEQQEIEADWNAVREASNERLVTSLAMICPFSGAEKQALLEAPTPSDRAETMTTILEMAVLDATGSGAAGPRH